MNEPFVTRPLLPARKRKRFPWLLYWVALALIILVALAPIFAVVLCGVLANTFGCKVDEGSVHPCIVSGKDYGELLYALGVSGWLMLATLPAGMIAGAVWLVALVVHRSKWQKRQAA